MSQETEYVPMWARKPSHKQKVVASKNGWIVESTGELLVSVKNLDQKLAEYLGVGTVTFDHENSQIVLENEMIVTKELPTSPIFVDGDPKPVVKVEDTLVPVVSDEPVVVVEVPETTVTEQPSPVQPEVTVVPEVPEKKPEEVVTAEEPVEVDEPEVEETVEVPVKKKAGRPKKVVAPE